MLDPATEAVVSDDTEGPAMSTIDATHSQFSEVREAARGRLLAAVATSLGIVAVTVATAAVTVVTLGA